MKRKRTVILKTKSGGYDYNFKYHNVTSFKSLQNYFAKLGHTISVAYFYDPKTKAFVGSWSKKFGFKAA